MSKIVKPHAYPATPLLDACVVMLLSFGIDRWRIADMLQVSVSSLKRMELRYKGMLERVGSRET